MEYGKQHGLDSQMLTAFWVILKELDSVFAGWRSKKAEQQRKIRQSELKQSVRPQTNG